MWEVATQGEGARLTHVRGTFLLLPPSPLASWGPFCWPRWGQDKLERLLLAILGLLVLLLVGPGEVLLAGHQPVLHRTN